MNPNGGEDESTNSAANELSVADLEARLNANPTLDTDVMEFLAIAGISYEWKPLYQQGAKEVRTILEAKRETRRASLSRASKMRETLMANGLISGYSYRRKFCTLRELKEAIESEGPSFEFNFGLKSIAYLNRVLAEYNIETFKVGGGRYGIKQLSPLGLEPSQRKRKR